MKFNLIWNVGRVILRPLCSAAYDLKVFGLEHVPRSGGVLLVSNHQSYLDPVLLGAKMHRPMSYLAKSELFDVPVFSHLIRSLNAFPVRQGAGDVSAVRETIRRLHEGHLLTIYPEGSRTPDGALLPMQPGVGLIVRKAGVPVVPVAIHGSHEAWPKGSLLPHPHPIRVRFGPALRTEGLRASEVVKLIDRTLHTMLAELRNAERPA